MIKEKKKWVTLIRRHFIEPALNLEKILQRGPVDKKYGTHVYRTFIPKKNKACSTVINGIICKKSSWRIKNSMSSKEKGSWTGNSGMYS